MTSDEDIYSSTLGMNVIRRNCDVNMLFLDSSNKNMFLFNGEDVRKMLNYYNNNLIYKALVNIYGSKYNDKNDIYFNAKQLLLYLMKYNNKDNNIDNYNKVIKRAKFNTKEEYNNFINECLNERVRNEFIDIILILV